MRMIHVNKRSIDHLSRFHRQQGKLGWVLLWAIGIPVPILLLLFLIRGCT